MKIRRLLCLAVILSLAVLAAAQANDVKPRLRISPGVAHKNKIHDVEPDYPRGAKARGIRGEVVLLTTIDTKGNVVDIRVTQGDSILADAAAKAVKQWKYRPFLLNGEPVAVETVIKIRFHI